MGNKTYKKLPSETVYTLLSNHAAGVTSEIVGALTPGTTYNFKKVPVVNGVDDEGNALYDTATTFTSDVDFISVTNSPTSQTLMWSILDGATGYELERATNSTFTGAVNIYTGPDTFFHDNNQVPGTIYHYRVKKTGGTYITYKRPAPWLYEMFDGDVTGWEAPAKGIFEYDADQLRFRKAATLDRPAIFVKEVGAADYVLYTYMQTQIRGGVILRYQDPLNFLMFRWHDKTASELELLACQDGTFSVLGALAHVPLSDKLEPLEFQITLSGSTVTAKLQHYNKTLTVTTTLFQTATKAGVWTSDPEPQRCGYFVIYPEAVAETTFKLYGVLEYFQEPQAMRYVGRFDRTYEGYVSRWGQVVIRWFDNKAQRHGPAYVVDNLMPEHGIEAQDDHNPPAIHILPNGKILIWYTVHDVASIFYQKITSNSENITTFSARQNMADAGAAVPYNYPQPIQLSDYSLCLFYRQGSFNNSKWVYKKSTDNGATWSAPVVVADNSPNGVYAYIGQNPDNLDEVHMAGYFAYSVDVRRRHVWYAKNANIRTGNSWTKSDGVAYTLPITDATAERALSLDTTPLLVTDIKVIGNKPYITYGFDQNPNHKLRWCEKGATAWVHRDVTPSRIFYERFTDTTNTIGLHQYTPGIILNPENPYEVVLFADRPSSVAGANRLEVEVWKSADAGVTWARSEIITQNSLYDNYRVQWVVNAVPSHRFIWCGAGQFTGEDGGNWFGYSNVRVSSEKDKIKRQLGSIPFHVPSQDIRLLPDSYVLSVDNITQWNDSGPDANHFVKLPASTSDPVRDATGAAVFGAGDSLINKDIYSPWGINQLSVFIRVKCNPVTPPANMAIIGNFQTDINHRSFGIYCIDGNKFLFIMTEDGQTATNLYKSYSIPYTTAETVLGFIFDKGVLTVYQDGVAVAAPTKHADLTMKEVFFKKTKIQIGHFINGTGGLHASFSPLDGIVKKVAIKKSVMTAAEITAF